VLHESDITLGVVPSDPDLHAALATLDIDRRTVVVCRYFLGQSEREIAETLKIRPGTVKSRLSRALAQLEVALGEPPPSTPDTVPPAPTQIKERS
jgi:RNA polymerase sigma-70 factor (ECF subfamily)